MRQCSQMLRVLRSPPRPRSACETASFFVSQRVSWTSRCSYTHGLPHTFRRRQTVPRLPVMGATIQDLPTELLQHVLAAVPFRDRYASESHCACIVAHHASRRSNVQYPCAYAQGATVPRVHALARGVRCVWQPCVETSGAQFLEAEAGQTRGGLPYHQ